MQPAPIQVSYLGFPGTTGAPFVDYLIADPTLIPPDHAQYYTEKLVYMPNCYQINTPPPESSKKFTRADFGLPQNSFVFCCFNNTLKIDAAIFATWMTILKAVPHSVLWLWGSNELAIDNFKKAAVSAGIAAQRLIFATKLPLDEHITRSRLADLALDTALYTGGATTSNAFAASLPVVTLAGTTYISRMGPAWLPAPACRVWSPPPIANTPT